MSGQPGVGDRFLKWVHDNRWGFPDSDRVRITSNGTSYMEFPNHEGLAAFDNSDRKFVATSNAHPRKPPILQATDSKWWGWKDALNRVGISVGFLCPESRQLIKGKWRSEQRFFKFPSTPHLALLDDSAVRGDKVMSQSEIEEILRQDIVVEEKVDGANLGISFDELGNIGAQIRGSFLSYPYTGQWKNLSQWLRSRSEILFRQLGDRYILFGEWCYARHSIGYDRLPDWFLGFDIYDKVRSKFFSCSRRDSWMGNMSICPVPILKRGVALFQSLPSLLSLSRFATKPAEGLYLRLEKGRWLEKRAKLVRPSFVQAMQDHWSKSRLQINRVALGNWP